MKIQITVESDNPDLLGKVRAGLQGWNDRLALDTDASGTHYDCSIYADCDLPGEDSIVFGSEFDGAQNNEGNIKARLEYLRGELRAERISWGDLAELQGLADHIEEGDVELLEAAGVPEFPDDEDDVPEDYPVKVLGISSEQDLNEAFITLARVNGVKPDDLAHCGTCGRIWNDAISTGMTPVPSGRCPFEYYHPTQH